MGIITHRLPSAVLRMRQAGRTVSSFISLCFYPLNASAGKRKRNKGLPHLLSVSQRSLIEYLLGVMPSTEKERSNASDSNRSALNKRHGQGRGGRGGRELRRSRGFNQRRRTRRGCVYEVYCEEHVTAGLARRVRTPPGRPPGRAALSGADGRCC